MRYLLARSGLNGMEIAMSNAGEPTARRPAPRLRWYKGGLPGLGFASTFWFTPYALAEQDAAFIPPVMSGQSQRQGPWPERGTLTST